MLLDIDRLKQAWEQSDSQYDFAQVCYKLGRLDELRRIQKEREADPVLNGVLHVIEHWKNGGKYAAKRS